MQPSGDDISMDFLSKDTETIEFIKTLKMAKMGPATILNYIKNMIRFVQFLSTFLHITTEELDYSQKCKAYIDLLRTLRKRMAEEHSRFLCKVRSVVSLALPFNILKAYSLFMGLMCLLARRD